MSRRQHASKPKTFREQRLPSCPHLYPVGPSVPMEVFCVAEIILSEVK